MLLGIDASRAARARRSGTETYSLELIRAMLRLESGHRFRLYVNMPVPASLFAGPGHAARAEIRYIPFPRLWTHIRLGWEVTRRRPDVLFVPAHVLPLLRPRHSVVTIHDLGYLHYPEAHRPADRRYLDWSTAWSARGSRAVVADSKATKADLVRAYGIAPEKIHVIYLGRDECLGPGVAEDDVRRVRARYGIEGRYLLHVGTLQPRKNLGRLVAAFAAIAASPALADVRLVLAGGRGWMYDELFAAVEEAGLPGRVLFPGYVDRGDLPALYGGALAYVFPSLYEGFGMPVLEAQACGVPVMTSTNSSLPEVAGDAALLVDPHDVDQMAAAMYRLVTDGDLRAELAQKGLANVQRFSWEKCARETLAVLQDAARGSR